MIMGCNELDKPENDCMLTPKPKQLPTPLLLWLHTLQIQIHIECVCLSIVNVFNMHKHPENILIFHL